MHLASSNGVKGLGFRVGPPPPVLGQPAPQPTDIKYSHGGMREFAGKIEHGWFLMYGGSGYDFSLLVFHVFVILSFLLVIIRLSSLH